MNLLSLFETFNNEIQTQEDNINDAINKVSHPYLNNQMVIDYLPYLADSVKHINRIMDPGYNSYNIDNFNKVNKTISNFDIPKLKRAIKDVTTIINQGNYQKAKSYIDEYTLYGGLYVDKDFLNQEEDMDNCMDLHYKFGTYANPNFPETDNVDYENLEDIEDKESQKKYVIAFLNFLYTVLFVLLGYQTYINNIFKFLHNELDLKKAYQLGYKNFIQ